MGNKPPKGKPGSGDMKSRQEQSPDGTSLGAEFN